MLGFSSMISRIHNDHRVYYRSGISSILVLKENIQTTFYAFYFNPFDPFYKAVNKVMGELADGGFLTYWKYLRTNPRGLKMTVENIGPQVLTMEHLMLGFQIYLITSAISIVAFSFELLVKLLRSVRVF